MAKQIRLNAFAMNCVAHQSPGLWTHPRDRTADYNRLPYWTDLAKTLERGRFDGLFLADVLGVYDVFGGTPDAALRDRARGVFGDPAKVHRVRHQGENYRLDAIHLSEPSPQRTPVLYQAGTSPRGRQFAARHAECVFMSGPSAKVIAPRVAAIRELAAEAGRNPAEILMFSMMTVILGRTEAEAKAKHEDYRRHISPEGALALMSGWMGIDFSGYNLDQEVRHVQNDAGRTALDNVTRA